LAANPTEVVKIRLQEQSYNQHYKGCIDCYRKIFRTEGIKGFWSGVVPNLTRNMIDSPVEIVSYFHSKEYILRKGWLSNTIGLHFICGLVNYGREVDCGLLYISGGESVGGIKDSTNDSKSFKQPLVSGKSS
jgi:hypothetical protein